VHALGRVELAWEAALRRKERGTDRAKWRRCRGIGEEGLGLQDAASGGFKGTFDA
jgi:hypothetical protein